MLTRSNNNRSMAPVLETLENRTLFSVPPLPLVDGKAQFFDADGDVVKIVLTGPGSGEITFTHPQWADAVQLDIHTESPLCTLSVTVTGKQKTTAIDYIKIDGQLKSFKAPGVALGRNLDMDASVLTTMTLGDVVGGADLNLTNGGTTVAKLTLGHIGQGTQIMAPTVPLSLTAVDWAEGGYLDCLSATAIKVTGDMTAAIRAEIHTDKPETPVVSITSLTVGGVYSGDVYGTGSIGTISARSLGAGSIGADSLGSLKTTGLKANPKKGILGDAGDVGSTMSLLGDKVEDSKNVLGSAKIVGDLTAGAWVQGNAGTVSMKNLRASLQIDGKANVKVADALSLSSPLGGSIGSLSLGSGKVTSGKESLTLKNASLLFATGDDAYQTATLMDKLLNANMSTFKVTSSMFPNGSATVTGKTTAVGTSAVTDYTALGQTGYSMTWANNGGQLDQTHWFLQSQLAAMDFSFEDGLSLPTALKLKQKYTDSSAVTGTIGMDFADGYVSADISAATATSATTILGHEEVTVQGHNYLAVKLQYDMTITGNMSFDYDGDQYFGKFQVKSKATVWMTPDDGVVKVISSFTDGGTVTGQGGASDKGSILVELMV